MVNDAFPKGRLLACEIRPFVSSNTAFCKPVCRVLQRFCKASRSCGLQIRGDRPFHPSSAVLCHAVIPSIFSNSVSSRHCLNGDFQFRAQTRNPENTHSVASFVFSSGFRFSAELKVAVKAMTTCHRAAESKRQCRREFCMP